MLRFTILRSILARILHACPDGVARVSLRCGELHRTRGKKKESSIDDRQRIKIGGIKFAPSSFRSFRIYLWDGFDVTILTGRKDLWDRIANGGEIVFKRAAEHIRKIFHCYRRMNQRINNSITLESRCNVKYFGKIKISRATV